MQVRSFAPTHGSVVGLILVLSALLAMLATTSVARAGRSVCRADPIVTLSNGAVITMSEYLELDPSDVDMVIYTLKAPRGTTITSITYTGDIPPERQQVILDPDNANYKYQAKVRVRSAIRDIDVWAATEVLHGRYEVIVKRGKVNSDIKMDVDNRP